MGLCAGHVAQPASAQPASAPSALPAVVRLRVAWGGGVPKAWDAKLQIEDGELFEYRSLATRSRAAAIQRIPDGLHVSSDRPISYEALDVAVRPADGAALSLRIVDSAGHESSVKLSLLELTRQEQNRELDADGNRLIIQRSPGDEIQVRPNRDHLVFSPGEEWLLDVQPATTRIDPGAKVRLQLEITGSNRHHKYYRTELDLQANERGELPLQPNLRIQVPRAEGVYDLRLTLDQYRSPVRFRDSVRAVRNVQFVVVSNRAPEIEDAPAWQTVVEFGAEQARWWDPLAVLPTRNRLPINDRPRVADGDAETVEFQGRVVKQLPPSGRQVYPLPVARTDAPHVVELECTAGAGQRIHCAIVETNSHSGTPVVGIAAESHSIVRAQSETIRIVFWPQTRLPYLMIENASSEEPVQYEAIRVMAGPDQLPHDERYRPSVGNRQVIATLAEPVYPAMFSARKARESASGRALTDWNTFLQGSQRFVEYLRHVGYTGAAVGSVVNGSTIFPVPEWDPASKYDTGAYFNNGQDPIQKDALELLFRLFDRERLTLIPIIRLNAPIPELERIADSRSEGLRLVDAEGEPYRIHGFRAYNPLDPRVQAAVESIVKTIVLRYSTHDSFGGVCLQLGSDSFAHLPGNHWALDRETLKQFAKESVSVSKNASQADLIQSLQSNRLTEEWLMWRAERITRFYRRLASVLTRSRPDATLHLDTVELIDSPAVQATYQPVLRPRRNAEQSLLSLGIHLESLGKDPRIRIARPFLDMPTGHALQQAVGWELAASEATDRMFRNAHQRTAASATRPTTMRWHLPKDGTEPSQVQTSLIGTSMIGASRRARFIESIAELDTSVYFDGISHRGPTMPAQLRRQLQIFTRLPAIPFRTPNADPPIGLAAGATDAEQGDGKQVAVRRGPVTVRCGTRGNRTTIYAVNSSPWSVRSKVAVAAPGGVRMRPLCSACRPSQWQAHGHGYVWQLEFDPFDIQAITVDSSEVEVTQVTSEPPLGVVSDLQATLTDLVVRVGQLKQPVADTRLANAGFESLSESPSTLAPVDWELANTQGTSAIADTAYRRSGNASLRIHSSGPVAWARSQKMPAPETGRISVHVWVRSMPGEPLPPLRLAIEGRLGDAPYYRYATITDAAEQVDESSEWRPFVLHLDDLPSLELKDLQVRFDLMGPGTAWLDDVTVYGLSLTRSEHHRLSQIIAAADLQLREGDVAACDRTLQRYWPRLLTRQLRDAQTRVANADQDDPPPAEASPLERLRQLVPAVHRGKSTRR